MIAVREITFRVDQYRFAVSALEVESIVEFPKFRSVPLTPESFMGVFLYRDHSAGLISLKRKFGIPDNDKLGVVILK
jgi:chemotaxis signal transduction protein